MKVHAGGVLAALILTASASHASSGLDSPESGPVQVGRGSAWLARADDPLAAYFNPAALALQPNGVTVGVHLMILNRCFTRLGTDGKPVSPGQSLPGPGEANGPDATLCTQGIFPNPQIAGTFRISNRFAVGLAVLGPHAVGNLQWPESVEYINSFGAQVSQPAPQRYMLTGSDAFILLPTLSGSVMVANNFSLGAGFIWGLATVEFSNFSEATSTAPAAGVMPTDDYWANQDAKATLGAKDFFIPGFVIGALWSPTPRIDVAGWFKWQDSIQSSAHVHLEAPYWKQGGAYNDNPCAGNADPQCNVTDEEDAGRIKVPIPMEAKLGFRYHHPRPGIQRPTWAGPPARRVRDSLTEDLFDVEFNITYANNSAMDVMEIRFRGDPSVPGARIPVKGTPAYVPTNADIPHHWKDVLGLRLGGDFVVLPARLALRAGAFFETKGQDDEWLNPDFHLGERIGVSGGGTVRVGPVDISLAYQHTFFGALDNEGKGSLKALSGAATAPDGRSYQTVNGGKLESSLNEIALGATLRF
jgi:long-chain fatty acid transport protein